MPNTFPSLTALPVVPLKETPEDNTIVSSSEGGYEVTRPRNTRLGLTWSVQYSNLTQGDKDALMTFCLTTVRGRADSFTWVHPQSGVSYTVRFDTLPAPQVERNGRYSASFTVKQI